MVCPGRNQDDGRDRIEDDEHREFLLLGNGKELEWFADEVTSGGLLPHPGDELFMVWRW
jgi:hypothetical protein